MGKVAKLVAVSLLTRVIVDEDANEPEILAAAKPNFIETIINDLGENIEYIEDDEEVPYSPDLDDRLKDEPKYDLEWREHPEHSGCILLRSVTNKAKRELSQFAESINYPGEYSFMDSDQDFTDFGLTTNPEPTQP